MSIANEVVRFWQHIKCPLLLVLLSCGHGGEAKRRPHVHRLGRRADLSGALGWGGVLEPSFVVVAADAAGPVEEGVRAVGVDVDLDPRPDEMRAHRAFRDLQLERPVGDAIVVSDLALLLNAQDLVEVDARDRREGRALACRQNGEANVVLRQIDVADEGVGRLDRVDPGERELLDQPVLQGLERPLPKRPLAWGEKAPMCSTPNCASARPTWVGQSRSISPALVVQK